MAILALLFGLFLVGIPVWVFVVAVRHDKGVLSVAAALAAIIGLVATVSMALVLEDCFVILESAPQGCEAKENALDRVLVALVASWIGIGVALVCTVSNGARTVVLIGIAAVGIALIGQGPDEVAAKGRVWYVVCADGCTWFAATADGSGKAVPVGPAERPVDSQPLSAATAPSPDGTKVVEIRSGDLYLVGQAEPQLLTREVCCPTIGTAGVLWSPDSRYVALYGTHWGQLSVVDTVARKSWEVAGGAYWHLWSPDSQHLAYLAWSRYGYCEVRVVQRNGSHNKQLARVSTCELVKDLTWVAESPRGDLASK